MLGGQVRGRIAVEDDGYRAAPPGGLDGWNWSTCPTPTPPGRGEIRVRLHASSLDDQDVAVVSGMMPTADGRVPMSDGAGVVEAVGAGVAEPKVGGHVSSPGCTPATSTGGSSMGTPSRPDANTRPRVPPGGTRCPRAPTCSARKVAGKAGDVPYAPDLGCRYPPITPRQPPAPGAARMAAAAAEEAAAVRRGTATGGPMLRARVEELVAAPPAAEV